MKVRYILLFVFFMIIISFIFFIYGKKIFIVRNIVIDKDFNVNNEKFIKYLGIEPNKYIWQYDIVMMGKKLARQLYLYDFFIKKRYPDTLVIFLRIRKPIARVLVDNRIMFIDKKGMIFNEAEDNQDLPLLIYNIKEDLDYGIILSSKYIKIIEILVDLKDKNSNIYKNISEISIVEEKKSIKYFVKYKGINSNLYLKNFINVDLLKRGFVFFLYLKENNIESNNTYFAGLGFVY